MAQCVTLACDQNRVTVPALTSIGTVASLISPKKPGRVLIRVQNTGTTVLYVNLSETVPTATVYHAALGGCGSANDGTGGVFEVDAWSGPVSALSSASGGTAVLTEILAPAAWL